MPLWESVIGRMDDVRLSDRMEQGLLPDLVLF